MDTRPDRRPLSPYMLGTHYRFQITSVMSITFRLTGLWLTLVTAPLAVAWVLCVAAGEGAHVAYGRLLASWPGQFLVIASLFCLCFHLCNGIRHLLWDTGRGLGMEQIRTGGWWMIAASLALAMFTWWSAS